MKRFLIIAIIAAVAVAAYMTLAGPGKKGKTLGKAIPSDAQVIKIADALKQAKADLTDVTVQGEIGQKCPTSGCWFYMKDDTGSVRVDLQFAGFNILDVPSGSKVTVHGKIAKPEDGETEISADGMKVER